MIALLMPILAKIFGGGLTAFVQAWTTYKTSKLTIEKDGFVAASANDAAITQAVINAEVQNNALKVQVYGQPLNRLIMFVAGFPPALHFGLVFLDTILAAKIFYGHAVLGVPKLPAPYDLYQTTIVFSFFLVQGVHLGSSNVSAWLGKK